jgi:hypothetical protein
MTTELTVLPDGTVTGDIDIDIGTLLGVQQIEIIGDQGTRCVAYIGDGTNRVLTPNVRRSLSATYTSPIVPLAQTFFVDEDRYVGAIELKLITNGADEDIIVQIREVATGQPTSDIIAEARIAAASLVTGWNTFTIPPTFLKAEQEYAICVVTKSTTHALGVGELGKVDSISGDVVTKQSYKQGVLLTSSNGTIYTENQYQDLMFKLKGCIFTTGTKTVDLGNTASLTNISDLMVAGGYELPNSSSYIEFIITDPDSIEYIIDKEQVLTLASKKTGVFNLKAKLTTTDSKYSPILFPGTQLIHGESSASEIYVSKMIEAGNPCDFTLKIETKLTGTATMTAAVIESNGIGGTEETSLVLQPGTKTTNDGWEYRIYKVSGLTPFTSGSVTGVKLKITFNGGVQSRIWGRKIVGIVS